jgi:RNA polymerase sigma-70 factor (ECF subfamily)
MIDPAATPDVQLERVEQHRLLWGLIDTLPTEKRTVFRLVHEADMNIQAIAETLGIPEGTVKSRLHYTLRELLQRWREIAAEWEEIE